MKYLTPSEYSLKTGIPVQAVRILCQNGEIKAKIKRNKSRNTYYILEVTDEDIKERD